MKIFQINTILILGVLLFPNCKSDDIPEQKEEDNGKNFTFDLSLQTKTIKNVFSDVNLWALPGQNFDQPADYFSTNYPFVKRVQFMTATGGDASRDLFINPNDRSVLNDYKFDGIITSLHYVVKQGLTPMIKTGAVPLKYSDNPVIGGFGVNVEPPGDFNIYYNYIKALADKAVEEFGIEEVKTWTWGVLTEYENKSWWSAGGDPALTKEAYFKLYDYTIAALEDAIGKNNLVVGAHGMVCSNGLWDELEFIDHVATGTNYKTGKTGTQIDFLAASFYDYKPGVLKSSNLSLTNTIESLRNKAVAKGLTNLKYGIDEGRILKGPDDRELLSRVVAHSFQGASDAKLFNTMNKLDADWFSAWGLCTEGFFGGVTSAGTHIANLSYKMVGEQQLKQSKSYIAHDRTNDVDGMGTYNSNENKVHVMVYSYNSDLLATTKENPTVKIKNIQPVTGSEVLVKQWIVDDFHRNYWPTWFSDMKTRGIIDNFTGSWSYYSVEAPTVLTNQGDRDFWYSNEAKYKELAKLKVITSTQIIENNTLVLSAELDHHGVVFYEIDNVMPTEK